MNISNAARIASKALNLNTADAPGSTKVATKGGLSRSGSQDAFAGIKAGGSASSLFGAALAERPETPDNLIAHGLRGHNFTDGQSAGMHGARHVQEVFGPGSLGIRQGVVLGEAEDIMNGVGVGDNDGNGVGERQEAVNAFNDEMEDRVYRTPLTQGAQQFKVGASLNSDNQVDVYTYEP